jgi:PIN domain nuclease of toxin-antitoxin system
MRLLLDTAVLIYAVEAPERLSRRAATAVRNLDNAIELSAVSVTEIAIKAASGKLASAVILRRAMDEMGIRILPYTADHAFRMFGLSGFPAIITIPLIAKSLLKH